VNPFSSSYSFLKSLKASGITKVAPREEQGLHSRRVGGYHDVFITEGYRGAVVHLEEPDAPLQMVEGE